VNNTDLSILMFIQSKESKTDVTSFNGRDWLRGHLEQRNFGRKIEELNFLKRNVTSALFLH
jgi:hypothetical protein